MLQQRCTIDLILRQEVQACSNSFVSTNISIMAVISPLKVKDDMTASREDMVGKQSQCSERR